VVLSAPASTAYSFLTGTFTNAYTYDAASNRTGYTAPDSSTNTYSYDTLNRLTTLASSWAGSFGFSYDSLSRRTQMTRPNSITTNYTYDSLSRLLTVLHQSGGSTIDGASYTLDSAGNRTVKVDQYASVTSDYTYDALYELTQATQGGTTTESYSYDPVGNRTASLGVSSYTTNSSNEMTANSNSSYTYDYNGSTTSKTVSSATTNYTWDYENRLASVTLPSSGGTVTFKYDPLGRRIQKVFTTGTTTTTNYLYDGDKDVEELNASGTILARYTQGPTMDEPLAESRSSATSFYEADGLGSITSLTNGSGTVVESYTYNAFGNLTASSGTISNPFQYTGRDFDPETGLLDYRARYYDPTAGRFLSEDPLGLKGGGNFYIYASNSPTNLIDPLGLSPQLGDIKWRLCSQSEEQFCKNRCDSQGQEYMSCRVGQTYRIVSLIKGPEWVDYQGEPSCWCKDPDEECPLRKIRVPQISPSTASNLVSAAAAGAILIDVLEEYGWVALLF
jgi:RHS repeat-associated protein